MTLRVPARPARASLAVLGSRFVAAVARVEHEDEGKAVREALRREFPDATHHCWGLSLRTPAGERLVSDDDGEPAGTSGPPILQAIRGAGVTNAIVVVARWFGGTKLGKGGLARAYRESARASLSAAGVLEVAPTVRLRLEGPAFADGAVRHLLARRSGRLLEASYDEAGRAVLLVEAPEEEQSPLADDLAALTRGAWSAKAARRGPRTG